MVSKTWLVKFAETYFTALLISNDTWKFIPIHTLHVKLLDVVKSFTQIVNWKCMWRWSMKVRKIFSAITAGTVLIKFLTTWSSIILYSFSSRFSQYNNLKRHVNCTHRNLRINCLVPGCSYSVARKDKYKNHLSSQHKFLDAHSKESILKSVKFE